MGLRYPSESGHRGVITSVEAAEAMKPCVKTIQAQVLAALRLRPMTSWEVAQHLRLPFETCQPRTSELQALHLIEPSGDRGPARSPHRTAIRWRVTERGQ